MSIWDTYQETLERVWVEDAATTRLPDHQGLGDALNSYDIIEADLEEAKDAGRCLDQGDTFLYHLRDGTVVVARYYPGASEIWRVPLTGPEVDNSILGRAIDRNALLERRSEFAREVLEGKHDDKMHGYGETVVLK